MGVLARFNFGKFQQTLNNRMKAIDKAIIANLRRLGEECVKIARENGNYIDQTGNLRSSIGYVLLSDGKIIERNFESQGKDENQKGIQTGQRFAKELSGRYSEGFVLIVVAGMNYAAAVESRSRDVLTSSEIYAKGRLPQMIKQLKISIAA